MISERLQEIVLCDYMEYGINNIFSKLWRKALVSMSYLVKMHVIFASNLFGADLQIVG